MLYHIMMLLLTRKYNNSIIYFHFERRIVCTIPYFFVKNIYILSASDITPLYMCGSNQVPICKVIVLLKPRVGNKSSIG